jgi:hypothetical protein
MRNSAISHSLHNLPEWKIFSGYSEIRRSRAEELVIIRKLINSSQCIIQNYSQAHQPVTIRLRDEHGTPALLLCETGQAHVSTKIVTVHCLNWQFVKYDYPFSMIIFGSSREKCAMFWPR